MKRDLAQWLQWFEQVHPLEMDLQLDRVQVVSKRLGIDTLPCPLITVGGTNGKGSTVNYLQSIYTDAGYSTGATVSPHILKFNERVMLNTLPLNDADLCEVFEAVEAVRDEVALTFFEFAILAAVLAFVRAKVDVIILEVGLGGRLDACNLWSSDVAIITNISLDHEQWLGKGRDAIGREKAGIARRGKPCLVGDVQPPEGLVNSLNQSHAEVEYLADKIIFSADRQSFFVAGLGPYPRPLMLGDWQVSNAALAVVATHRLNARLKVDDRHRAKALSQTLVPGRMQLRQVENRSVVFDVGHNPAAATAGAQTLAALRGAGKARAVMAIMSDKAYAEVVSIWHPQIDQWYVGSLSMPRALSVERLARTIVDEGGEVEAFESLEIAFKQAVLASKKDDLVVVFGSFYTVEAVLRALDLNS